MTLGWRKCPACNGTGIQFVMKSRIKIIDIFKKNKPIIPDENKKCIFCNGRGEIYIKTDSTFKPWNPFRKDK